MNTLKMKQSTVFNCLWIILAFLSISQIPYIQSESFEPSDELIFAHILFRHGIRNSPKTYSSDPWKDPKYWPGGHDALTNLGKQQMFELGTYFRRRYFKLMNNGIYHQNNIYVRSTDYDRTLMSAAYVLAGMYPPIDEQIWNKSLFWQAIPIHTIPENLDPISLPHRPCLRYPLGSSEYEQSPQIQLIWENHRSLIEYLNAHIGKNISTLYDIKRVYTALQVEESAQLPLPSWTEKVFYPGCELEKLSRLCYTMSAGNQILLRIRSGFLIREIFEHSIMKANSTLSPDRSIWIYSGHGSTLANVLNAFGLSQFYISKFGSSLMIELHKFNGTFHIEIFYKHDTGEDEIPLEPLFIPHCGQKCPLSKMLEIFKGIIPTEDFETECRLPPIESNSVTVSRHFSSVLIIIGLLSSSFLI